MLSIIKKALNISLQWKQIQGMSGRYNQKQSKQASQYVQPRLKRKMVSDIKRKCKQEDKNGADLVLDHQFYENMNNKSNIYEILRWKVFMT